LPYATLHEQVRRSTPEAYDIGIGRLPSRPERSVTFDIAYQAGTERRFRRTFVDPYSGAVLGQKEGRASFRDDPVGWIHRLHYTVLSGKPGYCAIGFLSVLIIVSITTGLLVYRRFILRALLFRVRLRLVDWRSGASDLHRVVGVWAWLFNLVIAATGLWFMRDVFTPGFYRRAELPGQFHPAPTLAVSLDALLATAAERVPDFVPLGLRIVKRPDGGARAVVMFGNDRRRFFLLSPYDSNVWFDARSGALEGAHLVSRASLSAKLQSSVGPLHYGQWGGVQVKMVYALFALAPPLLSITGFLLWLRRRHG